MGRDELRAADGDRQAVADRLRAALDEGRLDLHEYDERLQRAYTARTYGDLDRLLADLPGAVPASGLAPVGPGGLTAPGGAGPGSNATRRWLVHTWDDYLVAVAICVGIWAVISVLAEDTMYFWPGWVAGPWGVVLLVTTVSGLARGEPQRWAAKQERKRVARAEKRARKELDGAERPDEQT